MKELEVLEKTIMRAKQDKHPLSEEVSKLINGRQYLFASFIEGSRIKRIYMITEVMDRYPETQYLGLGLKNYNRIFEGHIISGKSQETNLKYLKCISALYNEESIPEQCHEDSKKMEKYSEYVVFTESHVTIVARIIIHNEIMEISCPQTSDVIFGKGLIILQMSKSCLVKVHGTRLRNAEETDIDVLDYGFQILYNGKLKQKKQQDKGSKFTDEEFQTLTDKLKVTLDEENGISPFLFDVLISFFLAASVVFTVLYKIVRNYCSKPTNSVK